MTTITIHNLADLPNAAKAFIKLTQGHSKFAFYGPMGSGKTTFIKAVCQALGAVDAVTSPSFALINEYRSENEDMFYHLDLYRIRSIEEVYDLGYEEYFYSDAYCFIEWPEKAENLLPPDILTVRMEEADRNKRRIHVDI